MGKGYREAMELAKAVRRTPAPDLVRLPPAPKRSLYEVTWTWKLAGFKTWTFRRRYSSKRGAEQACSKLERESKEWTMRHL